MRLDLDRVFSDFSDAWTEDPQAALREVRALLNDESACVARIEMLRRLRAYAQKRQPEMPPLPPPDDFTQEIALLADPGLVEAVDRGLLTPERIAAITRDPDALWAAHQAVIQAGGADGGGRSGEAAETEPTSGSQQATAVSPLPGFTEWFHREVAVVGSHADDEEVIGTHIPSLLPGFTELVRNGRWGEFQQRLRPWLPCLLRHVGMSEELAERLIAFICQQASQTSGGRFSELLPNWLEEFARREGTVVNRSLRTEEQWREFIEPGTFRLVLEAAGPGEPPWAKQFRGAALAEGIGSPAGLLGFEPSESAAPAGDLAAFRRELLFEALRKQEEAWRLFEIA